MEAVGYRGWDRERLRAPRAAPRGDGYPRALAEPSAAGCSTSRATPRPRARASPSSARGARRPTGWLRAAVRGLGGGARASRSSPARRSAATRRRSTRPSRRAARRSRCSGAAPTSTTRQLARAAGAPARALRRRVRAAVGTRRRGGGPSRARNRIIAGLCRRPCSIVEAGLPSGTFSTADHALDAGRDVLAVPGSDLRPRVPRPQPAHRATGRARVTRRLGPRAASFAACGLLADAVPPADARRATARRPARSRARRRPDAARRRRPRARAGHRRRACAGSPRSRRRARRALSATAGTGPRRAVRRAGHAHGKRPAG